MDPLTISLAFAGFGAVVNAITNRKNAKLNSATQKEISNTSTALQQERDTHQKEIDIIRLKQQDLLQQQSLAAQKSENKLNRDSQSDIARSNQQTQIEIAKLNALAQRGENQLTREQNERLSELNRSAQAELARFAQSFQHDENLLTRSQNDRLAELTREFQANEGKLSREHLEQLEIWRANLQRELSNRQRNLQLELQEIETKLTWEIRHFDRESARIKMREEKMLVQSPIWEAAKSILNNNSNNSVPHLHVFFSPPNLKYDTIVSPERNSIKTPEMEQYLNGGLRDFFGEYSKENRQVHYIGASAWMSKAFRGEAAAHSIFDSLKSEPIIIIESSVEGDDIEINFAYWGLGYDRPIYVTGSRFSWLELLYNFAKQRTLEWFDRREQAGDSESQWIATYGEDVVRQYQHNLTIIKREQSCLAGGDHLSDIKRDYQIKPEDAKALKKYLNIFHCLYAGLLADEYFLMELSPTHRQSPLLPRIITDLTKDFRESERELVLSKLLDAYRTFYGHLQDTESSWIPDLKLELADAFIQSSQQFGAISLLRESLQAFDTPRLALDPNVEISTLLTSLKSKLSIGDRDYVEKLNRSLVQLGIDDRIHLADCCYQRAIEYYRAGAARSSIIDFTHSIALADNLAANYYRGLAHIQLQEYANAIVDLTRVIDRAAPDSIVDGFPLLGAAYEQRGLAHAKLRDYHTAIPDFDRALQLGVTTAATHREIAAGVLAGLEIQQQQAELERQRLAVLLHQEEERRKQSELERQRQAEQQRKQAELERQRKEAQKTQPISVDLGSGVKLDLLYIPGGNFQMGDTKNANEQPQHQVNIQPFHIGKYPITQAQYQAVMGNNPASFKGDNRPVENVSLDDAIAFCQKLSQLTGAQYTLPSESQWEYGYRAGTTTSFSFGDILTADRATFSGKGQTTDVGAGLCQLIWLNHNHV
jgi:Sulfatase-modifying factor enzyme 1